MTQDFNDPELFADFIIEAKEHLETIEPNLLELEKSPDNLALLNEIFRPMHSLKGASGFLGLNIINRLAHKAENIMEELRKGAMEVTPGIMDVILSATDALTQLIDNLEAEGREGDVDVDPIIDTIAALLAGESAPAPAETPPAGEAAAPDPKPEPQEQAATEPEAQAPVQETKPASDPEPAAIVELEPYQLTAFGESHLNDFLEESFEIVEALNESLLELEKDPTAGGELVNDIFRYYHNLKGNSGIIGFKECNSLTHEAETLLNKIRKGEMGSSRAIIDLLLQVTDLLEAMIQRIEPKTGRVVPLDTTGMVEKLQQASAGKYGAEPEPEPESGLPAGVDPELVPPSVEPEVVTLVEEPVPSSDAEPEPAPAAPVMEESSDDLDKEDVVIFESTMRQTFENITLAMDKLREDSEQNEYIDALFRALTTVQNSSGYMGFEEIKVYAERTAKLVDQGRSAGIGFDAMLDILHQECSILKDMVDKELSEMHAGASESAEAPAPEPSAAEEPAPVEQAPEEPVAEEAPVQESKPEESKDISAEKEPEPEAEAPDKPEPEAVAVPEEPKTPEKPEPPEPKQPEAPARPKEAEPAKAAPPPPGQPRPAAAAAQPKPKVSSTIRVDHEKLDNLMNLIGELIINRNRFAMLARNLEEEDQHDVSEIASSLTETTYAMARISDELQDTIMKVRMVPVQTVFSRFPRLVRDLSRKSGKNVELTTEGEETELDKSVVEVIGDPLVHLIRNSVDHGIESEEVRRAAEKNLTGHVWLRAYHKGNSVAIEVEDDGKGIDPEKMREVGVNKGLITPEEAKALDDREAMELIFAPGFSAAAKVTDISGRGVGMDVVRTNIKNLKGSVSISSEVGKGTKFTLALPLTLAIIDALMVQVSGETFAIPLDAVSETTKIEADRLTEVNNRKAVTLRGEVLGIVDLCELLELPPPEKEAEILATVVIHDNERRLGLVVDRLLERQEIVIKPLGAYLGDQKGLSGATIMGDGSVVLILDPHEIYLMATSKAI